MYLMYPVGLVGYSRKIPSSLWSRGSFVAACCCELTQCSNENFWIYHFYLNKQDFNCDFGKFLMSSSLFWTVSLQMRKSVHFKVSIFLKLSISIWAFFLSCAFLSEHLFWTEHLNLTIFFELSILTWAQNKIIWAFFLQIWARITTMGWGTGGLEVGGWGFRELMARKLGISQNISNFGGLSGCLHYIISESWQTVERGQGKTGWKTGRLVPR